MYSQLEYVCATLLWFNLKTASQIIHNFLIPNIGYDDLHIIVFYTSVVLSNAHGVRYLTISDLLHVSGHTGGATRSKDQI